jgi:hypothetical protein
MPNLNCFNCGTTFAWSLGTPLSRRDTCAQCGSDSRVCRNCRHYEPTAKWACREHVSEAVREKEKANFCDSFQPSDGPGGSNGTTAADLRKAAESLFKKG